MRSPIGPRRLLRRSGVERLCQPAGRRRDSPRREPGAGATAPASSRSSTRASIRTTRCCRIAGPGLRLRPRDRRRRIGMERPRRIAGGDPRWVARSRFSISTSLVSLNGSTVAILDQDTASALDPSQLPRGVWPRDDGRRPRASRRADGEDHAAQGVQGRRHLDGVRCRPRDPLRRGPWRARHQHELQRDGRVARDRARDQRRDQQGRHLRRVRRATWARRCSSTRGRCATCWASDRRHQPIRRPGARSATTAMRSSAWAPRAKGSSRRYPGGDYAGAWGTSFSAPLAAGAAALLLQVDPTLDQAKADTCSEMPTGCDGRHGKGRLNLDRGACAAVSDATAADRDHDRSDRVAAFSSGACSSSASASDNVGVAGVRFLLDDNPLGAEDDRGALRGDVADDDGAQRQPRADGRRARRGGQPELEHRQRHRVERHGGAHGGADEPGRRNDAQRDRDGECDRVGRSSKSSACSSSSTARRWVPRIPSRRTR